jgi:hypothetical protein
MARSEADVAISRRLPTAIPPRANEDRACFSFFAVPGWLIEAAG